MGRSEASRERRDERWLSGVWGKQAFDRRRLWTTSGLFFKVVFPGMCGGGAGPDFRDAILALPDGSLLRGDVELHLESSGWRQHGHHRDTAYDRVLLHVVLEDDEPARNSQGQPVLTLELAGRLGPKSLAAPAGSLNDREPSGEHRRRFSAREADAAPYAVPPSAPFGRSVSSAVETQPRPGGGALGVVERPASLAEPGAAAAIESPLARAQLSAQEPAIEPRSSLGQLSYLVAPCQHQLPRHEPAALATVIRGLALDRFQAKQAALEGELAVFDPEQVLYASLLEALGYSRNRAPFRTLAQLAPLPAMACARSPEAIERLLLEAGGLAAPASSLIGAGLTGECLPAATWQTTGVRPENLPVRRIHQFAPALARLLAGGLLEELLAPLLDFSAEVDSGSPESSAAEKLRGRWRDLLIEIGPARADATAINVLLPYAAAYGQATCQFLLSDAAIQAFMSYPPGGTNQITRYMRRDILGPLAGAASGAAGEQGLLHIWDRWCHEKVCTLCPLASRRRRSEPSS